MAKIPAGPTGQYTWLEPESPANLDEQPVYPHNHVWETRSGHSIEMDDTKDRERIRIQHRSKTFTEMHPNGDEVHKVWGDNYEITLGRNNVYIKGHCVVTIEGDSVVNVRGNKYEKIEGDFIQEISGRYISNIKQDTSIISNGDMSIGVGDPVTGELTIRNGDRTQIVGDLSVTGSVTATNLNAETKVNAGTGVTAGILGFVTESGGVSVGIPVSSPVGTINAALSVTAGLSVTAPFITGSIVSDMAGTMMGMRAVYNSHFHYAPFGPTSSPIVPMTLL